MIIRMGKLGSVILTGVLYQPWNTNSVDSCLVMVETPFFEDKRMKLSSVRNYCDSLERSSVSSEIIEMT